MIGRTRLLKGVTMRKSFNSRNHHAARRSRSIRPLVEQLEDRITPATFVEDYTGAYVNSTVVQSGLGYDYLSQNVNGPDVRTENDARVRALLSIVSSSSVPGGVAVSSPQCLRVDPNPDTLAYGTRA